MFYNSFFFSLFLRDPDFFFFCMTFSVTKRLFSKLFSFMEISAYFFLLIVYNKKSRIAMIYILFYNASARHVRHQCDTSETRAKRVRHESYTSDTNATRTKNFDFDNETNELAIWQMEDYKERNNFILRTTPWKCNVPIPKCVTCSTETELCNGKSYIKKLYTRL